MMPIVIGALGGLAAFKLIRHFRYRGGHGPHGFRRRGPGRLFWVMRELHLDRGQKKVVWDAIADVRRAAGDVRLHGLTALDELAEAVAGDEFDRAAVDRVAEEQSAALEKVKIEVVAGLEKLHNVLTPDQRARLRELYAA
jgi:Spy/CpxP family protein refolding chaperone